MTGLLMPIIAVPPTSLTSMDFFMTPRSFFQHRRRELIGSVLIEHALESLHHIFDNALGALEKDVAGKAVSYYNVRRTGENARALDVADEIDAPIFVRLLQQCESLMLKLAALGVLGTDIQQADARVLADP